MSVRESERIISMLKGRREFDESIIQPSRVIKTARSNCLPDFMFEGIRQDNVFFGIDTNIIDTIRIQESGWDTLLKTFFA
jgi:hypothetical protein